jgi:hypothetical protein
VRRGSIAPGGLVLCEDGGGVQFIRGVTQRGDIFDFVAFGATCAMWDPWEHGAL